MELITVSLDEAYEMYKKNQLSEDDFFVQYGNRIAILKGLSSKEKMMLKASKKNFLKQ